MVNPDLSHNYKTLCEAYLNYSPSIKNDSFDQSAMENSDLNFQLSEYLKSDLIKGNLLNLFENLEMPLLRVLSVMELNGIKLDSEFLSKLSVKFHEA